MSITRRPPKGVKLKKGQKRKFIVRYRPYPGAKERSKTFTYDEYKDPERAAKKYDADQQAKLARGTWVDPQDMATPLIDIAREWVNEATKDNTRVNRQALVNNLGDLGEMPVAMIKASNITAWRNVLIDGRPWRGGRSLSDSTAANMVGQVCGLLRRAHQDEMIGRVPVVKIPKAAPMKAASRQDLLTAEETAALIQSMRDGRPMKRHKDGSRVKGSRSVPGHPDIARMMEVVVGTGLRISEVCGIRVCDVDFLRRTLTVNGQVKPGGRGWVPVPKSEKSQRTIPVPQGVIDTIALQLHHHPQEDREGPVFRYQGTADERDWYDKATLGVALRTASARPGVRKATWHDLRHLYAAALIAGGGQVPEVQAAMGHANSKTTLDTYGHLWPKADDRLRAAATSLFDTVRDGCGMSVRKGDEGEGA